MHTAARRYGNATRANSPQLAAWNLQSLHGLKSLVSWFFMSVFFTCFLVTCAYAGTDGKITVSAAISLKNAFEEIAGVFEKGHSGTEVFFNFGASGDLVQQIKAGAPVDVFASAAEKDMNAVNDYIEPSSRADFAGNIVVLVAPADSALKMSSFKDLLRKDVARIAVGDPRTVPAGRYAEDVFEYFGMKDALRDKLIYAENVRQVLDYVSRGEVDAGVVYSTDAMIRRKDVNIASQAPEQSHKPVVYPIAVVKGSPNSVLAAEFVRFVTSGPGKEILGKYGFKTDLQR